MKKKWLGFLTAAFALTTALGFAACGDKESGNVDSDKGDSGNGEKTQIELVYDQYVVYAEAEGQEPLSYEQWLETIKGATGEKGEKGDQGEKGEDGAEGKDGVGISSVTVNDDGALVITFTNGTNQTVDMPISEQLRYQKIPGKEEYRVMGIGTVSDLDIVIPATYRGLPVTEIGAYAFESDQEIYMTSVVIPNSVKIIGEEAFCACTNLKSVTLPEGLRFIGKGAFDACENLTSITIPDSVTSIGEEAFDRCYNLQYNEENGLNYLGNKTNKYLYLAGPVSQDIVTATINGSCKFIGESAFYYCESLTSVTIPDSVTSIGGYAFGSCDNLQYNEENGLNYLGNETNKYLYLAGTVSTDITTATIDGSCKFIGERAFYYCESLTSVTIPDSVTSIGEDAFSNCKILTSVTIGDSVTTIGGSAFYRCESLTSVTIPDSVTSIGYSAFFYCSNLTSVTFEGTVAEWTAAAEKYIFYDTCVEKVVCSDGEVKVVQVHP